MPTISIVVSVNKSTFWQKFCEVKSQNNVDMEIIFVGFWDKDIPGLPIKTVYTQAKATECWEIGARLATGKYLCLSTDDLSFTPGFFDEAIKYINRPFDMVTAQYHYNGHNLGLAAMQMFNQPHRPILPISGLTFKESFHKVGGIDSRFDWVLWDTDLFMRFCEAGGETKVLEGYSCNEDSSQSSMYLRHHKDRGFIGSLWHPEKTQRLDIVHSFPAGIEEKYRDNNILM